MKTLPFAATPLNHPPVMPPIDNSNELLTDGVHQALPLPVLAPADSFGKVEPEKLTSRRFPDWYVLMTLSQSFPKLAVNGTIPPSTLIVLREQFYHQQLYREARVVHQLIEYKKVLMGSATPWMQEHHKKLPGYSQADIQWLLEKVKAGQDVDDIISRHYDRKSREAMYRANWADIINVPLSLLVAVSGTALVNFSFLKKLMKPAAKV